MLRRLLQLTTALAIFATCTIAPAAEQQRPSAQDPPAAAPGIAAVTDANGNPVPVRQSITGDADPAAMRQPVQEVQRGQAWWPYGSSLPPYTFVDKRAESMSADEIQVNGVALINVRDTEATLKLIPKDLQLAAGSQSAQRDGYYLVKIAGASRTQEQIDALTRAGATLGEYMNVNTYFAKIPSGSLAAVKGLPFVTFVGDYHPAYKISPRIGLERIPVGETVDAAGRAKPWLFEVTLHSGAELRDALANFARIGIFPDKSDIVSTDELTVVYVATQPENVILISQLPEVKWIAEKSYASLQASATNPATIPMILQNNAVYTTNTALGWKLWNAGIDGTATSQIVTMMDTGLDTNVEHMSDTSTTVGTVGPSHRKVIGYDVYGGDQCVLGVSGADEGHGTWTTQHAVGSISNMTSNPDTTHTPTVNFDNGIARGAKVYFQDIGIAAGTISPPGDLGPSITAAIGKGSFVQNNSWGTSSNTYDSTASLLDTALFNNPNFVVTVSAGNRGAIGQSTIGSPSTAKNCIGVGGNDISTPDDLFINCSWDGTAACASTDLGSSRGPVATSLRVKPDIMTYVYSSVAVGGEQEAINEPAAMCQTDAVKTVHWNYVNAHGFGGTSFAAPEVAGLAAVVRDYFMQGFYPSGSATPANVVTPSGSLVKAIILASGEAMATASSPSVQTIQTRYSNDVGYGRANVPGVLHIGSSAPFLWVQNNASLGQAATNTSFYNINGNGIPLRVMMVWYDAAGNTLQKDANLRVTIGANVYLGNVMSGSWSITGGTADGTNTTEGVFLDAAHGLPATGSVKVEVIGANNPSGMNYSLVVSGNVASATVKQVALDKGQYNCAGTIGVSVNDTSASSPVSVTLTSRNSVSAVIDTKVVSCTGAGGVFTGSIVAGSGIIVANGGTVTATYSDASPSVSTIACQAAVTNGGFTIAGGCDNAAAGSDIATGPLSNGGSNEFYNKYMDANEYSSYRFSFVNTTGAALSDATVALSFSGAGASKMTVFNSPLHIGFVAAGATAGGVFQLYTDPTTAGLTSVNLNFDVTSPADGYTTATRITHVQLLQTNDQIARQNRCSTFNTLAQFQTWTDSAVSGHALSPWKWSGSATTPSTVSSENRVDGMCGNATANAAAMVGNSAITSGNNFAGNSDSVLLQNFAPALTGNGPSGQPYHYAWAWHSFYHASETLGATTGMWNGLYNDQWNNVTNPTGTQASGFPYHAAPTGFIYFQSSVFDYLTTWNWETANTGTPDNPNAATPPPNQFFVIFNGAVTGLATATTRFAYGHEHADYALFNGGSSTLTTRRDVAFDNDNLVYDEYYADAQAGTCGAGSQVGQVAFDQIRYGTCPTGPSVISVLDADGISGMTVTVTSPGTGDSEVVTLTGSAPYFSGPLTLSTVSGVGANNGTLFVLPAETISATYTDTSPAGSSTATADVACVGGDVQYVSNAQVSDNGDNDGIADNNECVTMDITIKNNTAAALTNARVQIFSNSPNVDLIPDDHAAYGTVGASSSATNPASDRFTFHVASSVACSDPANPPTAKFTVVITADGLNGPASVQTFTINLDQNVAGGTTTYTQNFTVNPGWTTAVTAPDNAGCTANTYTNNFHWCTNCGSGGAGNGAYGAWIGNNPFGTTNQQYSAAYDSSTLYSPVFTAGSTSVTLQFRTAYRTEPATATIPYDGAIAQYQLAGGNWTTLAYTTPVQLTTTASNFCSPIVASSAAWGGTATGTTWTLTNAASVATSNGQSIQFRWRLGGDSSGLPATYGGFGVDDVSVAGLRAFVCEPNRNTGVTPCCLAPTGLVNNTAVDPNLCSATGVQVSWAKDPDNWGDGGVGTRTYDVLRDNIPIQTGIAYGTTTFLDTTAVPGSTYSYSVRYNNGCGSSAITAGVNRADSGNVTCNDSNVCTDDSCNPATGCVFTPNSASCSDGSACTTGDFCGGGSCQPGTPLVCNDGNVCTTDTCNPGSGCVFTNNTASCSDGNACTTGDVCSGGSCQPGTPLVCNDSNACTDDTCNPGSGCVFTNNTAPCSDGSVCTVGDTCGGGSCQPGTPLVCNDSNACTDDTCNPGSGCVFTNNTAACDDGNACTTGDACGGGSCQPGTGSLNCNDNNPCTDDSCVPATGCSYANNTGACDDGNACTTGDTCGGGSCLPGTPLVCNDSNACTDDSCIPATGCSYVNNTAACDDGNACTTGDACGGGSCQPGTGSLNCNDNNGCTDDSCVPATGCSHANNTAACEDGNACTFGDTCGGGSCQPGAPVICDDSNSCTSDSCNPGTGCVFVDNTVPCDDGNACTTGDTCGGGTCNAGTPVPAPPETQNVVVAADKATYSWSAAATATNYDVVRGGIGAFPVGPGGGDETCFDNLPTPSLNDPAVPPAGTGFFYLSRGESACGNGTFGTEGVHGAPGAARVTTTCP